MTIDLLPTLAEAGRRDSSGRRIIDGRDIWPLLRRARRDVAARCALFLLGQSCTPSAAATGSCICRIRISRWRSAGNDGVPGKYVRKEIELSLFDLQNDPGETTNVAPTNPAVVSKLLEYAERAREDLGDSLTKRTGKNVRAPGI